MEYRSPLGFNFKLEESLSASKDKNSTSKNLSDTPKKEDFLPFECNSEPRRNLNFDSKRNSRGDRNSGSPNFWRQNNSWKSPNPTNSHGDESVPISQFYHPSMLEDPWEELEKNVK